jgi:hypothetical protein
MQRAYYQSLGSEAWNDQIPFYLTNSLAMAEAYAELIVALLRDLRPDRPLMVVELGCGVGRLAYHLCQAVRRKLSFFPDLAGIHYVCTDFVEATVCDLEANPKLVELGVDFCLWRDDGELFIRRTSEGLAPEGPWVIIANYFFDSLPFDEFRFSGGKAEECLIEVIPREIRKFSGDGRLDIRDCDILRSYAEVGFTRYAPGVTARILDHYRGLVDGGGAVTIPVGAIEVLERLMKLGTPILICSDRGFTDPRNMAFYTSHPISLHAGCFSHMVNFHALSMMFCRNWTTQRQLTDGIQTVILTDYKLPTPEFDYVFHERLLLPDLPNQASEVFAFFRGKSNFSSLLSLVYLNLQDPHSFSAIAKRILDYVPTLEPDQAKELLVVMERVWANDYHTRGGPNVTFWLGQIHNLLGHFEKGFFFLEETARRQGDDHMLCYLRGSALHALGRFSEAALLYRKAIEFSPDFLDARQALLALPKVT